MSMFNVYPSTPDVTFLSSRLALHIKVAALFWHKRLQSKLDRIELPGNLAAS